MNKPKKSVPHTHRGLLLASNPAIGVACPGLTTALQSGNSEALRSDYTNVALDASIMSFKGIREIAEALPKIGESLKATCGVMILVLETIKVISTVIDVKAAYIDLDVQTNRDGWRELAEIMQDKNRRVVSLLGLYAQAPENYGDILEQANKYQK
jgi:hypothetical protein